MLYIRNLGFTKRFSTKPKPSPSSSSSPATWRTNIKQLQLVSQISSILLQHRIWTPHLLNLNLNLNLNLTPSLFLKILSNINQSPTTSLDFFTWAKTHLGFQPDLACQCRVVMILVGSGLYDPVRPLLDSLVPTHQASLVLEAMVKSYETYQASRDVDRMVRLRPVNDSLSYTLSLVLERYADKGLFLEGLEVYRRMRIYSCQPSACACNSLLDALLKGNEIKLAWCLYGAMVRNGVLPDRHTWSLIARLLGKDGKLERVARLLEMDGCSYEIYDICIKCYGRNGDFYVAFALLDEMRKRKVKPGFSTCSLLLDEACRRQATEVIEKVLGVMVEIEIPQRKGLPVNNWIICQLCDMEKLFAAEVLFNRALERGVELKDFTYGCMLRTLSKGGRIKEAVQVYHLIRRRGMWVDDCCYDEFVNALCKADLSGEEFELLLDVIGRGFIPSASELSNFLASLCGKHKWRESEELFNLVFEMGFLPDSFSCSSLMANYCSSGQIDKAIALHNEIKKLNGSFDLTTYNALLGGLMGGRKVEEAVDVFQYMRRLILLDSTSFTIMIRGLCRAKEMKKAMKIHDEMIKMGMKPDQATYKRLITGFK